MFGHTEKNYSTSRIGKRGIRFPYGSWHAVRKLLYLDRNALSLPDKLLYIL